MRKLPRLITLRVERETAETFHARMAARGTTASAYLRDAIHSALTAPAANSNSGPAAHAG